MEPKAQTNAYVMTALSDHTDPKIEVENRPILVTVGETNGPHALEVRIREGADVEAVVRTLRAIAKFVKKEGLGVLHPPDDEGDWGWIGKQRNWVWRKP